MKKVKILGPGCAKCKTTYNNALEALKQSNADAEVEKIEDIEEMLKYNIMSSPAVVIDDEVKIKGRVAQVQELIDLLS